MGYSPWSRKELEMAEQLTLSLSYYSDQTLDNEIAYLEMAIHPNILD